MIYTYFSNAFDRVSHSKLLRKLKFYGIEGSILNWIINFLSDRKQRVTIGNDVSDWCDVTSAIAQGSKICPLGFNIFINDLPHMLRNLILL